jgi:hypothetical protein
MTLKPEFNQISHNPAAAFIKLRHSEFVFSTPYAIPQTCNIEPLGSIIFGRNN